ncbi:MAG TPA: polyphosphate kinase 2 family protein [Terriglobia bacterium]|jgi:PPK2 family polyphosphate:nucleotide phosphotransferase
MTTHESRFRIRPSKKARLSKFDPADTRLMPDKALAETEIAKDILKLEELQQRLYAEHQRSLLVILQGMDAGGKDGTIKHVMSGLNPQACVVASFKVPAGEELEHDYLWRIERTMPRHGYIGVFNRSQYEDVLAARVHKLVPAHIWKERYDQINRFERLKTELGTVIVKFFLHISKDEQKRRLEERLASPQKNWKFSAADVRERKLWDDYQDAYEDVLTKCSTKWAPWYLIPANHKWYRNWMVARTIVETLEAMDLEYPRPKEDLSKITIK